MAVANKALKNRNITAHETRTLSHPLSDLHVLKDGDSFGIFNNAGDMEKEEGPAGLFLNDTRLIADWRIAIENASLQVLSHSIDDYHILSTAHLACRAFQDLDGNVVGENNIYIRREKFIRRGTLYERIIAENHGHEPAHFRLALFFNADFQDMFQVRGTHRNIHGMKTDIQANNDKVEFRYTGMDDKQRSSIIRFSEPPTSLGAYHAEFDLRLAKGDCRTLIVTAGCDPGQVNAQSFDDVLAGIRERIRERLKSWTGIRTSNTRFNEWLEDARIGISLLTTLRKTGLYPYAGIPWFSTPFGRDGIITALQTIWLNTDIARGVLAFLADTQAHEYDDFRDAEPGKILHELREGEMANTGEIPFGRYYGGIDSTPLFIVLAGTYYDYTGDIGFIRQIWPAIVAALAWMEKDGDPDGDGFLEYKCRRKTGLTNQGWKDSHDSVFHAGGALAQPPIALCEVQAYAYAAYKAAASLASALGAERAGDYEEKARQIYDKVNEVFWSDELGCYVLALDRNKEPCLVRSSNNGHMLWCGIVPEDRAHMVADMLMDERFFTGWGIRTIASEAKRYNPLSYHNGSVWPHDTAIAAAGMARYGFYKYAEKILEGLFAATQDAGDHWLPELFCGFSLSSGHDLVRYPAACTLQAWACGSGFMALQAALGLELDNQRNLHIKNRGFRLLENVRLFRDGKDILEQKFPA